MSETRISNLPVSVSQRLLNLSHQRGEDFNEGEPYVVPLEPYQGRMGRSATFHM